MNVDEYVYENVNTQYIITFSYNNTRLHSF